MNRSNAAPASSSFPHRSRRCHSLLYHELRRYCSCFKSFTAVTIWLFLIVSAMDLSWTVAICAGSRAREWRTRRSWECTLSQPVDVEDTHSSPVRKHLLVQGLHLPRAESRSFGFGDSWWRYRMAFLPLPLIVGTSSRIKEKLDRWSGTAQSRTQKERCIPIQNCSVHGCPMIEEQLK